MKKFGALIVCICFCVAAVAAAEGVWVDETWREVKRQVDCDGLPLVIDARVLQVAEDAMGQEYHTQALSNAWMKEKMKAVIGHSWAAIPAAAAGVSLPMIGQSISTSTESVYFLPLVSWLEIDFSFKSAIVNMPIGYRAPIQSRWTCRPSAR